MISRARPGGPRPGDRSLRGEWQRTAPWVFRSQGVFVCTNPEAGEEPRSPDLDKLGRLWLPTAQHPANSCRAGAGDGPQDESGLGNCVRVRHADGTQGTTRVPAATVTREEGTWGP